MSCDLFATSAAGRCDAVGGPVLAIDANFVGCVLIGVICGVLTDGVFMLGLGRTLFSFFLARRYENIWVDLEVLFLCVYVLEFILKLVAQGFCSRVPPKGYFTSGWNILDFVVVCEGIISLVIFYSTTNDGDGVADVVLLSVLRAVRLLRPLRLVTNIHSLRLMLGAIFKSGLLIGTALFMVGFCFFILAIPGLALLQGQFRQRCFWSDTGLLVLNG